MKTIFLSTWGIIIRADNFEDDLHVIGYKNAIIRIEYEYDQVDTNGTESDTSDDVTEKCQKPF